MSLVTRTTTLTLATLTLAGAACSSGNGDGSDSTTEPVVADCEGTPEDPCFGEQVGDCSEPGDAVFVGEQKASDSGALMVELVETSPAPPQRFDNAWTVLITDAEGTPVETADVAAKPFMPDHGHPSPTAVEVENLGGGKYLLDPINLFMPGLWRVKIDVLPEAATDPDPIAWKFCLP